MGSTAPHGVIVTGGDAPAALDALPHQALVIAADGGLATADRLGLAVDAVIGDMDSVDADRLAELDADGSVSILRHPTAKDASDFELAVDYAIDAGAATLTIIGGGGGRFAHVLAAVAVLSADRLAGVSVTWRLPSSLCFVARPGVVAHLDIADGPVVSLFPIGGMATATAEGLAWPLADAQLSPHSSLGLSNKIVDGTATVSVASGIVLVIQERLDP